LRFRGMDQNHHQRLPTLYPQADKGLATPGCASRSRKSNLTPLPRHYDHQWYHHCVTKDNLDSQVTAGPPADFVRVDTSKKDGFIFNYGNDPAPK
jgi:hypothetical protein